MRALLLTLALTVAAGGAAGVRVGEWQSARAVAPQPEPVVIPAAPVSVGQDVIGPFPLDGAFVYRADPQCAAVVATTLPDLTRALCYRAKAIDYLSREVSAGRITPGPGFTACTYPSDPSWAGCVAYAIRRGTPEIRYGVTPLYVTGGLIGSTPYTGCAAGLALDAYIRVSLADLPRSYRLVAWETANHVLAYTLDLLTSADGTITGVATDYAAQACGTQ